MEGNNFNLQKLAHIVVLHDKTFFLSKVAFQVGSRLSKEAWNAVNRELRLTLRNPARPSELCDASEPVTRIFEQVPDWQSALNYRLMEAVNIVGSSPADKPCEWNIKSEEIVEEIGRRGN